MKLSRCSSILLLIAISCFRPAQSGSQSLTSKGDPSSERVAQGKDVQRLAYESWIRGYRDGPLAEALGDDHPIKLTLTAVEGDDLVTDPKTASAFGPLYRVTRHGCAISTEGTVSYFYISSMDIKGSGPSELSPEEFERLSQLIEELPDDDSRLPPLGHRIVLQVATRDRILARVYDRANAPQVVLEILRLSHCGIRPMTLDFSPQKRWPVAEWSKTGIPADTIHLRGPDIEETTILAISPDRYLTVRQVLHDTPAVTITDTNASNVIRVLRVPQAENRFVGITNAEFTPDGRYLMLLTTLPAIRIYDTKDWHQVGPLPDLPAEASLYYPSSDWKQGIVVKPDGEVTLWDAASRRQVAKIDVDGGLFGVSFSPDDAMVATTSGHENKDHSSTLHLRIWNVLTGEMVEELRPFEQITNGDIGEPIWWPDGKFLLATVRDNPSSSNHDIGIWSIQSGRFRGEFSGCVYSADPLSIVLHDATLFERCRDGMILMWDAPAAIHTIATYENSVTQSAESK